MGWMVLPGHIFIFSAEVGDATSSTQMLIYSEKKRRVIKKGTYIVIFSFPRFQHFCLSQTELLSNTALHEFKIKTLTSATDFGLQDRSRQSPTERQIRD